MPRTLTSSGLQITLAAGEEGSGFSESYGPVSQVINDAVKIEGSALTGGGTTITAVGTGLERINFIYIENRDDTNFVTVTPTDGAGAQTNPYKIAANGMLYADLFNGQDCTQVKIAADTAACQVVVILGEKA